MHNTRSHTRIRSIRCRKLVFRLQWRAFVKNLTSCVFVTSKTILHYVRWAFGNPQTAVARRSKTSDATVEVCGPSPSRAWPLGARVRRDKRVGCAARHAKTRGEPAECDLDPDASDPLRGGGERGEREWKYILYSQYYTWRVKKKVVVMEEENEEEGTRKKIK